MSTIDEVLKANEEYTRNFKFAGLAIQPVLRKIIRKAGNDNAS